MNQPIDHHYLPVFFLTRWAGPDGRVCRFSRPNGKEVKTKRVVPKGTGFEPGLYEIRGLPPERAQSMEKDFMATLDSLAADALRLLEQELPEKDWTSGPRSSWSRFMLAQMLRAPEDIAQLKSSVGQDWGKAVSELEEVYTAQRSDADPPTLWEYLEQLTPGHADEFAFRITRTLMNHSNICKLLNNMHWRVLRVADDDYPLLTSDRPIWMTATLSEDDAFITMPIGPRRLFTATVNLAAQARLLANRRRDLVKAVNKIVVQHAVKFVYGQTDAMLPFVQKHMSTKRHSSLTERLGAFRGHKIVDQNSPMAKG